MNCLGHLLRLLLAVWISLTVYSAEREYGKIVDPREGRALAQDLIAQWPDKGAVFYGTLKIRDGDGKRKAVPVKYTIVPGEESWQGIYETQAAGGLPAQHLVVVHKLRQPNEYVFAFNVGSGNPSGDPLILKGTNAAIPFAGSDYWLSDLGLEFLRWPEQRLIKDAKITMRVTRPCKVLESLNSHPRPGDYLRVVSWIDAENGVPIKVEAYGQDGKLLKVFSLKQFKKVNGRWQPTALEIQNERTDSRTSLEFQFETE